MKAPFLILLCLATVCRADTYIPAQSPIYVAKGLELAIVGGHSHSMAPALLPGEYVYLDRKNAKAARVGDIISNGWATHRVTAANARAVYTSGDNNRQPDGWTKREDIEYIVRLIVRP